jgi:DNA-binding PadR family transcriptional regulator
MLSGAELQLLLLALLEERPRHGYDLIKGIQELTSGAYVPSPGMVYPALSYLEESGRVALTPEGTKKLYSLTDVGEALLRDNRAQVTALLEALKRAGQRLDRARQAYDQTEGSAPSGASALEAARRDLKAVLFDCLDVSEDEQQRIAAILQRTIAEIRKR